MLELASERPFPVLRLELQKINSRTENSTLTRVWAAIGLGRLGDRSGQDLVRRVAFEDVPEAEHALSGLPVFLGDAAAPMLLDFVQRSGAPSNGVRRGDVRDE